MSSLERLGIDKNDGDWEENSIGSSKNDDDLDDEEGGIDNEGFNHYSIRSWTARAGSFVAEKMAFFERLGENYRGGFFGG